VPNVETAFILGGGGCIYLGAAKIFDLLVHSTITTYGTKYNKCYCPLMYARAYVHAPAPTRLRTRIDMNELLYKVQ
jgi:hypothetical protein